MLGFNIKVSIRISHVHYCDSTPGYNEDSCLKDCLVTKYIEEFNCIHTRLIPWAKDKNIKVCSLDDLKDHLRDGDNYTDPGLLRLRELYNAFDVSSDVDMDRCGCWNPCRETRFKIRSFKSEDKFSQRVVNGNENFGLFLVSLNFYTMHCIM